MRRTFTHGRTARLLAGCAPVLLSVGCAGTERTSVAASLTGAGLPPTLVGCMTSRLEKDLSPAQLVRLTSIGEVRDEFIEGHDLDRFWSRLYALGDAELVHVAAAATLTCSRPLAARRGD